MKQKKPLITLVNLILIIFIAVIAVIASLVGAYYVKSTGDVSNTFTPSTSIDPDIVETFDGSEKKDVKIQVGETGYPVYVRAAIIITWQDAEGIVYYSRPEAGDFKLDLNLTDWQKGTNDDYYYYLTPVESGGVTTNLINSCTQIEDAPAEGYTLNVNIIVETVQAIGTTDNDEVPAWKNAWGIS